MINPIILEDLIAIHKEIDRDFFKNKTILISGASGFIPSYLVYFFMYLNEKYKDQNTNVIGIVRNLEKAKKRFHSVLNNDKLNLVAQDVSKPFVTKYKINIIFHAASQASPKYYKIDPVGTLLPNSIGTYNLLELAKINKGCSLLFFSSGEIYGSSEREYFSENDIGTVDPIAIRSCYSESKRFGENMCVSYAHQYKMDVKIVRPFHTYGPGMDLEDGRVFADFVSNIVTKSNIEIKSDGKTIRSYCYLKDAIIGVLYVLTKGLPGEAYNVGNPDEKYSVKELAELIFSTQERLEIDIVFKKHENQNYLKSPFEKMIPSINKLNSLGWKPKTSAFEGFSRTIKSYDYD